MTALQRALMERGELLSEETDHVADSHLEIEIALWRQPRDEDYRSVRIDALSAVVDIDADIAEPLLREALELPEDPWVVLAALERISHHRVVGLRDAVEQARGDPRRAVAQMAGHTAARLVSHG